MSHSEEKDLGGKLLNVSHSAAITGVSVHWWRKKIFEGKLPVVRIGRRVLIPKEFVDKICREGWTDD